MQYDDENDTTACRLAIEKKPIDCLNMTELDIDLEGSICEQKITKGMLINTRSRTGRVIIS